MDSFGNLGYTLGGHIQPGMGSARFGYTPNPVNPPSYSPSYTNRSPYGSTNAGWNGWQYSNNVQNQGAFNPAPTSNPNQHMDWRNIQNRNGSVPQYSPVTTSGPSSFQFQNTQQMVHSYPYAYNNANNSNNNASNNVMGHYGQGAATTMPANSVPFGNNAIPAIIEEKPMQCHVKIGDQGQQPVVYVGSIDPNEKNNSNSTNNSTQAQYNQSGGDVQQQPQIHQFQPQQQQPQPQHQQHHQNPQQITNHCDTGSMMNQLNTQIQNHNQQQMSQSQRNFNLTPCGQCAACQAQMKNKMIGGGNPHLVRGPKVQPRSNMMKTTSAPQIQNGLQQQQPQPQQQQQQMGMMPQQPNHQMTQQQQAMPPMQQIPQIQQMQPQQIQQMQPSQGQQMQPPQMNNGNMNVNMTGNLHAGQINPGGPMPFNPVQPMTQTLQQAQQQMHHQQQQQPFLS